MKNKILIISIIAVIAGSSAYLASKDVIILGTATPGGGFPVYGAAFSEAVNSSDISLQIKTQNTKGSIENISLLEIGKLDIALVQGEAAHEAFNGIGRKPVNLKIISAMYSTAGMFAVRSDSRYKSIMDLKGQKIAFGAKGSGLVILARYILSGIGFDMDRDFKAVYLDRAGDGPDMLTDGRVEALWGGGIGWPGFVKISQFHGGARFIVPDEDQINIILEKNKFLKRLTIPAGSYKGQGNSLTSVGSWSFVLSRENFPDGTAYRIAKALHKSESVLEAKLKQASETKAVNTISAAPRLEMIHPGVLKYYREIGLIP